MGKYVGTWLSGSPGDAVKLLRLSVRDTAGVGWGTAVSLGWVPTLEVRKAGDTTLFATLTGTWEDADEDAALFAIGAASSLAPVATVPATPNQYIDYESIIVMTKSGQVGRVASNDQAASFDFRVQAWP